MSLGDRLIALLFYRVYISNSGGAKMKYVVPAVLALVAIMVVLVVLAAKVPSQNDICRDLGGLQVWVDQVAKHNHRLRVRKPELQNDFNSNGVTHSIISVYSHLYALEDKLGCR
jgi:hypothetical protein